MIELKSYAARHPREKALHTTRNYTLIETSTEMRKICTGSLYIMSKNATLQSYAGIRNSTHDNLHFGL